MPERTISKIMAATETADVARMAMIEAIRQLGDNGKATNEILKGMQAELRDVRERVIRIEASEYSGALKKTERDLKDTIIRVDTRVDDLGERVDKLEAAEDRRKGALGLVEWFTRNWPAVIGFAALVGVLVATGRITP